MQNIEDIAVSNYQTNMQYFKLHHDVLHNKLIALDTLLGDGRYPQKYDLEYKDDYFDVIELSSGNFLYNKNSEIFSDELTSQINFKKSDQIISCSYNLDFTQKALEKLEKETALTTYATTAPIMHYHNSNVNSSMHMDEIHKFIFLGIGLGLHLPKIIKKTGATLVLIVEDDIELFRLSLFTCNYKEALDGRLGFFSIAQNSLEFSDMFQIFYSKSFLRNYCLKFSLFSSIYEKKIKQIQTFLVSRTETSYPIEYLLYKNITILSKLQKGFKFLELTKKDKEDFFQDKPMLIIGAGPSLHTNIKWLKKNADKFILISVFAALKTLYKSDIKPDIVVQIDEKVTEAVNLMNSFDNFDFLANSIFVFSASVPDILFETFQKDKIYLIEDRTKYRLANTRLESASVGETAYAISLIFNTSELYLLGLDFALSEDGGTHAKDHHGATSLDTSNIDKIQTSVSISQTVLHVKGNFVDSVPTTPILSSSIPILNRYTKKLKSTNQIVYNLSNGAYLEQTIPLNISDFQMKSKLDKKEMGAQLIKLFDTYSLKELSGKELSELDKKLVQIKEFHTIIEKFLQNTSSNKDILLQNYSLMIQTILNSFESELKEILTVYFLSIAPYVIDLFNTKELSNPKKHTKKMKNIIVIQLKRLIELYEIQLKNIV
ncbi:MAG: DUF115 domain-containing protein [Sulfurimonas sp.]|nr:DUF115 domain-containing protein [Sulfurimonas sp.]